MTTVLYSNVRGGWPGEGNIDTDPLFVYANPLLTNENLHLSPGSPCIDAADATALPAGATTDLDGNPRLADDPCAADTGIPDTNGLVPDMGAYEFQGASTPPTDLDGDCLVSSGDLLLLLSAWGPCADCGDRPARGHDHRPRHVRAGLEVVRSCRPGRRGGLANTVLPRVAWRTSLPLSTHPKDSPHRLNSR